MADRTITTDLIGRDRMSPAFESAGRSAEKSGGIIGKVGSGMGTALKAGAVVAGGGLLAVGAWMAQGVKDAVSYETVLKKTAAVLKSTGGASGQTVQGIQDQAAALETLSGVDEELIINSENVLATFTNIKNVGKNKIFDEATKSSLDMSVALGTDLQGASILVGKALNDPVKGMTALSKSGVTFTDSQKKAVAQMVKTGDTAGAQKLILAELNKEFGGAAKAAGSGAAGDWARFQDILADTGRTIGQALLPMLTDALKWLTNKLPGAIDAGMAAFGKFKDAFTSGDSTGGFISDAGKTLRVFVDFVRDDAIPVLKGIVTTTKDWAPVLVPVAGAILAITAAIKIWQAATRAYIAVQAALNVVMTANPIGLVVLAIVGLTAAFVVAWKKSQTFREIMSTAFAGIATVVLTQVQVMLKVFRELSNGVLHVVETVLRALGKIPGNDWASRAADEVKGFRDNANKFFDGAINKTEEWKTAAQNLPKKIKLEGNISDLNAKIDAAKDKLKTVPKSKQAAIKADISQLQERVRTARANLATIKGKTVYITYKGIYKLGKAPGSAGNGLGVLAPQAKGGPYVKGQPYLVGEEGPEMRIPSENGLTLTAAETARVMSRSGGGRPWSGGGGGDTYIFHVSGFVGNEAQLADRLVQALERRPAGSRKIPASAVGHR